MHLTLATEHFRVTLEYIGESIALYTSTAFDIRPPQHNVKPHYFGSPAEAKAWIVRTANNLLNVGYEVV